MPDSNSPFTTISSVRLVTGADLNHHQTLYAGRCVEWAVHAAYIGAESCFDEARPVVFMKIRNFAMRSAAQVGELLRLESNVDYVGDSTIGVFVRIEAVQPKDNPRTIARGRFLFCTVDENGKSVPHGLPALSESQSARWNEPEPADSV